MTNKSNKILLIGWDAADWNIIHPLMANGYMPTFKKFVEDGISGNLASLEPPFSPMLWTSVATGKTPEKHGILGFIEPHPEKMAVRPVNSTSRTARAIWNILHHEGYRSNVVGWWPSYPAEPINGAMVSNFFAKQVGTYEKPAPVANGMIHPMDLAEEFSDLRMYPEEMTGAQILPFIPDAANINEKKDRSLHAFTKIFSQSITVHSCATWLAEHSEWDFMAVYFDSIDHYCHAFMKYHPPKLSNVDEQRYERYHRVVSGGYRFQDMMLERMLNLIPEDTTVIIMSDHGFQSTDQRITKMPKFPAAPALEHRHFGIFAMKGPGIKKGEKLFGASLLDITPTLLTHFNLPIGKDMDGKPLLECFEESKVPTYIDSWEDVKGDFGTHSDDQMVSALDANEGVQQLIELGYIEKPNEDQEKQVAKTKNDLQYNLARVHLGKKQYEEAEKLLTSLVENDEPKFYYHLDLVMIQLKLNQYEKARIHLEKLKSLDDKKLVFTSMIESKILIGEKKIEQALALLKKTEKERPNSVKIMYELGTIYLQLDRYKDAQRILSRALNLKDDHAHAHHALSLALLRQDKFEEAALSALQAIELIRNFPKAHYTLGEALEKLGKTEEAKKAYEFSLHLSERNKRAEQALDKMKQNETALNSGQPKSSKALDENTVVIVSGLPRSGTSMMMQMLYKGGIEVVIDEKREADGNNPKGYFEYEPIKSLAKENSWVPDHKGKAMKVVAQLLRYLPVECNYKVIFMHRNLDEIITSQQVMLGKNTENYPLRLVNSFKDTLKKVVIWEKKEPGVEVLNLHYTDVIHNAENVAEKIGQFLGKDLNTQEMKSVVDASLYRNRSN